VKYNQDGGGRQRKVSASWVVRVSQPAMRGAIVTAALSAPSPFPSPTHKVVLPLPHDRPPAHP